MLKTKKLNGDPVVSTLPVACFSSDNSATSRFGCVATFKNQQESDWLGRPGPILCSHFEQLVDELNLLPNI